MRLLQTKAVSVGAGATVRAVAQTDVQKGVKNLIIQNSPANTKNLEVLANSTDTLGNGIVVVPGASMTFGDLQDGSTVWLLSQSGTIDVRVAQMG